MMKRLLKLIIHRLTNVSNLRFVLTFVTLAVIISVMIVLTIDFLWDGRFNPELEFAGVITPFLDALLLAFLFTAVFDALREEIKRRKQSEEALSFLSLRHTAILSAVPDIIMEVDNNKVYAWANDAGYAFFGDDVVGKEAAYYFEGEQTTYNAVQPLFAGCEELLHVESWQRRKDGEKRLLAWRCRALKDSEGNVRGAVSTARDITDRRLIEEAIYTSEQKFKALFNAGNDAIMVIDPAGRILDVNDIACERLGYRRDALLKMTPRDFDTPEYAAKVPERLAEIRRQGSAIFETAWVTHDGRIIPVEISARAIEYEGKPAILSFARDITERKKAEEALHMKEQQLREAQRVAQVGSWDWDATTDTIVWSEEYYHIYGLDPQLPTPNYLEHLKLYTLESRAQLDVAVKKAMATGEAYELDLKLAEPTDTTRWICARGEVKRDAGGQITGLRGTAQNITERKRAEKAREAVLYQKAGINLLQQSLLAPATRDQKIKRVTDEIVRLFDADFCRIWLIHPGDLCEQGCIHSQAQEGSHMCRYRDRCLHLRASSGRYTHTDGEVHRRVPFGCYKIGLIASGEAHKFLTNDVQNDPRVHNHDWARDLGLVSFAGYQLRVPGGQTIGVLALFAKHPISADEDTMLDGLSSTVSLVIQQAAAEEALRKSEQFNRSILESVDEGFIVIDRAYRIISANKAFTEQAGMTLEEVTGKLCFEISHHCIAPCWENGQMCAVKQVFDTGETRAVLHTHYDVKGSPAYVETKAYPLAKDESGRVMSVIEIIVDVTEKKKAEEAVKAAAREWSESFDAMADGVSILDADYTIMNVNQSLCKLLGKTSGELIGRKCYQVFHGKACPIAACPLEGPRGKAQREYIEIYEPTIDKWLAVSTSPLLDEDGRMIKAVHTVRDVTEHRQAEENLAESENKYRTLLENIPQKIFYKDTASVYISCNKNYASDLRISPEEIAGKTDYDFFPKELAEKYRADDRRLMEMGKLEDLEEKYIQDGRDMWVHTVKTPVKDSSGRITGILGVFWDITEFRKLEAQLRHAQKMEAIGTLAGGVAHDFNNILNVIIGYGVMAKGRLKDDRVSAEHIDEVLAAADRAAILTRRLLAFSRKQAVEMKPVNINEVIAGLDKMISRLIGEDIVFTLELAEDEMIVLADAAQIEQVIMNLATNARDAMPKGGRLTIGTAFREIDDSFITAHGYGTPGPYALISVTDTGTGIDEETRKKIFEPFFTTKGIGEGTGLGLSISYGIVKQHDGYIQVYSEKGKGTTFKILLPVVKDAISARQAVTEAAPVKGGTETILVAEDETALRKLMRIVLESFGYKVITAQDGEEAISRYVENKDKVQLVILDMIMPRKSGKEAHDEIRKINPGVKAVFVSGYTMDLIHSKELLEEGMNFILKPVSPKDLVRKVREVLDR